MQQVARKYGGQCVSAKYINSKTHLRWKCSHGHEWTAKADHVLKGHWCPICSAGISERICRELLERMTGVRFLKARPNCLGNKGGKPMELDGYAPSLGVAFEYQGEQHYHYNPFFHENVELFEQGQAYDERKRRLCRRRGIVLLEIPYHIPHRGLQVYLASLHDREGLGVICARKPINISELELWRRKDCGDLRTLAFSRDGVLLSSYYIDANTKLSYRCKEGHEWKATPASVRRGTWCRVCGNKRAAIKRAHTIERMKALAARKGGVCLSDTYRNVKSRLRWQCREGHEFETQASVILAGHWCPKCQYARLQTRFALKLEDIQETAARRNGACLSDIYVNTRQKLIWQCADGHIWRANANSIRRGSWCPSCARKRRHIHLYRSWYRHVTDGYSVYCD